MKLKNLIETVLEQEPSMGSEVEFNVGKEIDDLNSAISKYKESAINQFKTEVENALLNKVVSGHLIKEIEVKEENGSFYVILKDDSGKKFKVRNSVLKVTNDVEGPVTNVTQRKSQPTDTPHKVKQF